MTIEGYERFVDQTLKVNGNAKDRNGVAMIPVLHLLAPLSFYLGRNALRREELLFRLLLFHTGRHHAGDFPRFYD
jgi:hypothetical protein